MVEMILNKQRSLGNKKCHADLKRENLILSFIEKFSTIYSIRNGSTVFLKGLMFSPCNSYYCLINSNYLSLQCPFMTTNMSVLIAH